MKDFCGNVKNKAQGQAFCGRGATRSYLFQLRDRAPESIFIAGFRCGVESKSRNWIEAHEVQKSSDRMHNLLAWIWSRLCMAHVS